MSFDTSITVTGPGATSIVMAQSAAESGPISNTACAAGMRWIPICIRTENTTTPSNRTFVNAPTSQNTRVELRAANARKSSPKTRVEKARLRASDRSRAFNAQDEDAQGRCSLEQARRDDEAPLRRAQHRFVWMPWWPLEDILLPAVFRRLQQVPVAMEVPMNTKS